MVQHEEKLKEKKKEMEGKHYGDHLLTFAPKINKLVKKSSTSKAAS